MRTTRRRAGISEFIAALIMIAITLVAGTAAFGWILSQAGTSEQSYGNSVAANVNFINERFALVSEAFHGPSNATCPASGYGPTNPPGCSLAYVWLFNTGKVDFTLFSIEFKGMTSQPGGTLDVIFTQSDFQVNSPSLPLCTGASGSNTDVADGFPQPRNGFKPTKLLPQVTLSPGPVRISMPTCSGTHLYLLDNTTYLVTLTGLYGYIVPQAITPNG